MTLDKQREAFGLWSACDDGHVVPTRAGQYVCPADRGDGMRCCKALTRLGAMPRADAERVATKQAPEPNRDDAEMNEPIVQHERAKRAGIVLP